MSTQTYCCNLSSAGSEDSHRGITGRRTRTREAATTGRGTPGETTTATRGTAEVTEEGPTNPSPITTGGATERLRRRRIAVATCSTYIYMMSIRYLTLIFLSKNHIEIYACTTTVYSCVAAKSSRSRLFFFLLLRSRCLCRARPYMSWSSGFEARPNWCYPIIWCHIKQRHWNLKWPDSVSFDSHLFFWLLANDWVPGFLIFISCTASVYIVDRHKTCWRYFTFGKLSTDELSSDIVEALKSSYKFNSGSIGRCRLELDCFASVASIYFLIFVF